MIDERPAIVMEPPETLPSGNEEPSRHILSAEARMHIDQLNSALEAARRMRDYAETQREKAMGHLHQLALELAPQQVDEIALTGDDIEEWDADKLGRWLAETVKQEMTYLRNMSRQDLQARYDKTQQRVADLEHKLAQLAEVEERLHWRERDLGAAQQRIRDLEKEGHRQQRVIEKLQAGPGQPTAEAEPTRLPWSEDEQGAEGIGGVDCISGERETLDMAGSSLSNSEAGLPPNLPEWMSRPIWSDVETIITAMGQDGLCRPKDLPLEIEASSDKAREVKLGRIIKQAVAWRLIQKTQVGVVSGGQHAAIRLTDAGRALYQHLTGAEPVTSQFERLLKMHKSPEQSMLALLASDVFRQYQEIKTIDLFPTPTDLASGRQFRPDMRLVLEGGEVVYVELEVHRSRQRPRLDKWAIHREGTGGQFHFVVPHNEAQNGVLSEMTPFVMHAQCRINVSLCNLARWKPDLPTPWTLTRAFGKEYRE